MWMATIYCLEMSFENRLHCPKNIRKHTEVLYTLAFSRDEKEKMDIIFKCVQYTNVGFIQSRHRKLYDRKNRVLSQVSVGTITNMIFEV